MSFDLHTNFAYATVAVAPSPASSGTSLTVAAGLGALFAAVPANATVWPIALNALSTNAEIVRVTGRSGDVLTIVRAQEGTSARTILAGDQLAITITAKTLTDVETAGSVTPFMLESGPASGDILAASWTIGAGWTGGPTGPWTHTPGSTATLENALTIPVVIGSTYKVVIDIGSQSAGFLNVGIGDDATTLTGDQGAGTFTSYISFPTTLTGLVIAPSSDYDGAGVDIQSVEEWPLDAYLSFNAPALEPPTEFRIIPQVGGSDDGKGYLSLQYTLDGTQWFDGLAVTGTGARLIPGSSLGIDGPYAGFNSAQFTIRSTEGLKLLDTDGFEAVTIVSSLTAPSITSHGIDAPLVIAAQGAGTINLTSPVIASTAVDGDAYQFLIANTSDTEASGVRLRVATTGDDANDDGSDAVFSMVVHQGGNDESEFRINLPGDDGANPDTGFNFPGNVTFSTSAATFGGTVTATDFIGPVLFPTSDPGIPGAWWNNAGTLVESV